MSETEETQKLLEQTANSKYRDIVFKKRGGTRDIFFAPWGPSMETRVLKVDREFSGLDSPRALRHVQRGYNTEHERKMAGILQQGGGHPGLNRLVDYWQLPDGRAVNVYEHFAGTTLEEVVLRKPLNREEFIAIFRDVISASKYMINAKGVVHRDKKPSNILVNRNAVYEGGPVAQLTDFTNAEELQVIANKAAQALPTVGGHHVTDPRLAECFTGAVRTYNIQDEMYQDTQCMMFSAHGLFPYEFDADRVIGVNHLNGQSLLTQKGRLDEKQAEKALEMALDKLPRHLKGFRRTINRGLTGDMKKRYSSVDEFANEFDKAKEPGLIGKLRKHWKGITVAAALGASTIIGGAVPFYNHMQEQRRLENIESNKYEVVAAVDGINLEVGNNLFDMELLAFKAPTRQGEPAPYVPREAAYIRVNPGDQIYSHVNLVSKPIPKKLDHQWGVPTLEGRMYIEGSEGKKMSVSPRSFNGAINWDMGMSMAYYDNSKTIVIPKNTKPGNYRLVAEFYAPEGADSEYLKKANLKFKQPGKIIARRSIPITVGADTLPFGLRSLTLGFPDRVSFGPHEQYARSNEPGLKAISEVIGGNRLENAGDYSVNVSLPPVKEGSKRIVQMYLEHNGQEIFRTAAIVQSLSDKSPLWEHYVPDKNFYKTLQNIMPFPSEQ